MQLILGTDFYASAYNGRLLRQRQIGFQVVSPQSLSVYTHQLFRVIPVLVASWRCR